MGDIESDTFRRRDPETTSIRNWQGEAAPVRIQVRRKDDPAAMANGCVLFDCAPTDHPMKVAQEIGAQLCPNGKRVDEVAYALVNSKNEILTTSWNGAVNGDEFGVISLSVAWTISDLPQKAKPV